MVASGYLLAFRVCDNTGGVMLFFLCYFSFRFWIAFQSSVYGCRCRALFSLAIFDILAIPCFRFYQVPGNPFHSIGGSLFMVSEASNYVQHDTSYGGTGEGGVSFPAFLSVSMPCSQFAEHAQAQYFLLWQPLQSSFPGNTAGAIHQRTAQEVPTETFPEPHGAAFGILSPILPAWWRRLLGLESVPRKGRCPHHHRPAHQGSMRGLPGHFLQSASECRYTPHKPFSGGT